LNGPVAQWIRATVF